MKNFLAPVLPALALLTLGGCASSSYLTTTENDGMYYSSSDKVVAAAPAAVAGDPDGNSADVVNPDYTGSTASAPAEYYDDDYYYASRLRRFHSPYRGPSLGYYDFMYTDPFYYGGAGYGYPAYGYSPYGPVGYYDPFYRPYYGYGGLTINIGIGFGRPFGVPYGYGYGYNPYGYCYSPYGYSPYGYGYGNGYYNGYATGYYGGLAGGSDNRYRTYTGRRSRASYNPGVVPTNGSARAGRSRVPQGGFTTPDNSGLTNRAATTPRGRGRVQEMGGLSTERTPETTAGNRERVSSGRVAPQPSAVVQPEQTTNRRWRVLDNSSGGNGTTATPTRVPDNSRNERGDYGRRRVGENPGATPTQPEQPRLAERPQRQRLFERTPVPAAEPAREVSRPTRSYSAPTRSEPSRSYSAPARSAEPSRSYSPPSRSSSGSSGNSGGGRGRVR